MRTALPGCAGPDGAGPDCAGNAIAVELLATSRRVMRRPGEYGAEMVDMARNSVQFAIGWLRGCRRCRQGRCRGESPLCGAGLVPAGR